MARIEFQYENAVVIIGSGAGGGTLAHELTRRGIKVVVLEAGKRQSSSTFSQVPGEAFLQLTWLDARTQSGDWGVATLGAGFAAISESERVEALKKIESSAFFQTMRLKTLQVLYSSSLAYAYFGYEGESFSKGGYLLRGFNDLRWLPEVPAEDSGPLPAGA